MLNSYAPHILKLPRIPRDGPLLLGPAAGDDPTLHLPGASSLPALPKHLSGATCSPLLSSFLLTTTKSSFCKAHNHHCNLICIIRFATTFAYTSPVVLRLHLTRHQSYSCDYSGLRTSRSNTNLALRLQRAALRSCQTRDYSELRSSRSNTCQTRDYSELPHDPTPVRLATTKAYAHQVSIL